MAGKILNLSQEGSEYIQGLERVTCLFQNNKMRKSTQNVFTFRFFGFYHNPKLERRISFVRPFVCLSRSGYPPWILKRGGLESSGRIPSS